MFVVVIDIYEERELARRLDVTLLHATAPASIGVKINNNVVPSALPKCQNPAHGRLQCNAFFVTTPAVIHSLVFYNVPVAITRH